MSTYLLPALFAVLVWWVSTGVILWLDSLPSRTFRWSMLAATLLLGISLYGLAATSTDTTVAGAYWAFAFAILVWGWQEMAFLMGYVTGIRRDGCHAGCSGWAHFRHAVEAIIYHELVLICLAILVVALTWAGTNQTGTWTFIILWALRQSAKLNLFLGVPNLNKELLPEHLRYLDSFLTTKPMNLLFPVSITMATIACVVVVQRMIDLAASPAEVTAYMLLATLLVLAIAEHWFMVLPLPAAELWRWARPAHDAKPPLPQARRELQSWRAPLAQTCDAVGLHNVLEAVTRGAFGDVLKVEGIARAGSGWVQFAVMRGQPVMTAFVPRDCDVPEVEALGQRLDVHKLQAAFSGCAEPLGRMRERRESAAI